MKKVLLLVLFSVLVINTQAQHIYKYVKQIKPIEWNQMVILTNTQETSGNTTSSTLAGAGVGYILHGGLLGTVVGGAIGNAVSTPSITTSSSQPVYHIVKGYELTLDNGSIYKTFDYYPPYSIIDLSKLKIQN